MHNSAQMVHTDVAAQLQSSACGDLNIISMLLQLVADGSSGKMGDGLGPNKKGASQTLKSLNIVIFE